jgi:hypothetical protein
MDIRSFGARPARRLAQAPPRPRISGKQGQGAARAGALSPPGRPLSGFTIAGSVHPRSARDGYAMARRMQKD